MRCFVYCLPILLLAACLVEPAPIPDNSMLLTGIIERNPYYIPNEADEDPYIISHAYIGDSLVTEVGVGIMDGHSMVFISCKYVFVESKLSEMFVEWGECDDFRVVPYGIEVANERVQFLLLEPSDGFWGCWDGEGRVGRFEIWVEGNVWH